MAASTNGNLTLGLSIISSNDGNNAGGSNPTITNQNQLLGGFTFADYSALLARSAGATTISQPSSEIPDELKTAGNGLLSGFSHLELMKLIQQQQIQQQLQQQQQARAMHQSPFDAQHAAALLQSANAASQLPTSHLSSTIPLHMGGGGDGVLPSTGNLDGGGGNGHFTVMARTNFLNDALRAQLLMNPSMINLPLNRSDVVAQTTLNHQFLQHQHQQQQLQLLAQLAPNSIVGTPLQAELHNNASRLPQFVGNSGAQMTLANAGSAAFSPNVLGGPANAQLNGLLNGGGGSGSTGSPSLNLNSASHQDSFIAAQQQQQLMRQRLQTQKQPMPQQSPQQQLQIQRGQQSLQKARPQSQQQQQLTSTSSASSKPHPMTKQTRLAQAQQAAQQQQMQQQQQQQAANSAANQQRQQQQEVYLAHQRQLADYANLLAVQQQHQQQQATSQQQQQTQRTLAFQQPPVSVSIQSTPIAGRPLVSPNHQLLLQQLNQQHLHQQLHQQQEQQQQQIQVHNNQNQKRRMSTGNVDAMSRVGQRPNVSCGRISYAAAANGVPATKAPKLNSAPHSTTTAPQPPIRTTGQNAQPANSLMAPLTCSNGDLHTLAAPALGVVQGTRLTSPALVALHDAIPATTTANSTLNPLSQPLAQALVDDRFRAFLDNVKLRLLESSTNLAQMSQSEKNGDGAEAIIEAGGNSNHGAEYANDVATAEEKSNGNEVQVIDYDEGGSPPPSLTEESKSSSTPKGEAPLLKEAQGSSDIQRLQAL